MGLTRKKKQLKNNPNSLEVGDYFRIIYSTKKTCQISDKIYQISGMSKSQLHVYYEDKRTNVKCKCFQCSSPKDNRKMPNGWYKPVKSIMIGSCELYMTQKQYKREQRLKKILG